MRACLHEVFRSIVLYGRRALVRWHVKQKTCDVPTSVGQLEAPYCTLENEVNSIVLGIPLKSREITKLGESKAESFNFLPSI